LSPQCGDNLLAITFCAILTIYIFIYSLTNLLIKHTHGGIYRYSKLLFALLYQFLNRKKKGIVVNFFTHFIYLLKILLQV